MTRTVALVLLLSAVEADASYWVGDFEGPAQNYRVLRNGESMAIEQLKLLQPGDTVVIESLAGHVRLIDEHNGHRILTKSDTPFVVPESELPPRLLLNFQHWVESWWSTRGKQNTSSMAAVSRGDLNPTIVRPGGGENLLLEGTRKLYVWWQGGIGPFDVSLRNQSGQLLASESGLTGYSAALPERWLQSGRYTLEVTAGDARSSFILTVVGRQQLPAAATEIIELDVPDEVRFGHLAMLLSAHNQWRFEALQLAREYEFGQLTSDLLAGNFPDSAFNGMTSESPPTNDRR